MVGAGGGKSLVAAGRRIVETGAMSSIGFWDYPVQRLEPSFAPNARTALVGDADFGLELVDLASGRTLATPRLARQHEPEHPHRQIRPSTSGRWFAHTRPKGDSRVGVFDRTGSSAVFLPLAVQAGEDHDYAWHPQQEVLAYLVRPATAKAWRLYTWAPEAAAPGQPAPNRPTLP